MQGSTLNVFLACVVYPLLSGEKTQLQKAEVHETPVAAQLLRNTDLTQFVIKVALRKRDHENELN